MHATSLGPTAGDGVGGSGSSGAARHTTTRHGAPSRGSSSEGCARTTSIRQTKSTAPRVTHFPREPQASTRYSPGRSFSQRRFVSPRRCRRCRPSESLAGLAASSRSDWSRMVEGATPAQICSVAQASPTQLCTRRRCLTLEGGGEACEESLGHNATSYPCGVDEPIQRRRTCSATASTNPYGVVISDHVRLDFDGS